MAIPGTGYVAIGPLFSGRSGTPFSATGEREYVQKFRVVVNDKRYASVAVGAAPGIPLPYSPYVQIDGVEYDLLALCVRITAEQEKEDDWSNWIVTCYYSTVLPKGGGPPEFAGYPNLPNRAGSSNNPELEPPDLEWDFEIVNKALQRDREGKPYLTSAKVPFQPAITEEVGYPVLVLTRNELNFNAQKAVDYAFSVNDEKFLGAEPETVLCYPPRGRLTFRGPLVYWRVTYRLKFAVHEFKVYNDENDPKKFETVKETWQPQYLDAGTMRLEDRAASIDFGLPVPILRGAHPVSYPCLLDGKGQPAKRREDGTIPETYIKFVTRKKKSFKDLLVKGLA